MKAVKRLLILLAVGSLIALTVYFGARIFNPMPKVVVKVNPEYKQTDYYIIDEHGRISLTTYQAKLNKGSLRLRSNSGAPITQQAKYVSLILGRVLKDEKKADLKTFFIGRLLMAFGQDRTMSERLAQAAANSPLWDSKNGQPVSGHANPAVKNIGNSAIIYKELKQAFNKHGLDINISGTEKVLINKRGSDLLPIDAMTWFYINEK